MTLKQQLRKLKDNWLLLVVAIILVGALFIAQPTSYERSYAIDKGYAEPAIAEGFAASSLRYAVDDFAPEAQERDITLTSWITTQVKRGEFESTQLQLKNIAGANDALITNENVNTYGEGAQERKYGSYTIKVPNINYEEVLEQIKDLGEVTSLNENSDDITQQTLSIAEQLATERAKLARYTQLYNEATELSDKLMLTDRIASQGRTIAYLEQRQNNNENRVTYATLNVNLQEKSSGYAGIALVSLSDVVRRFVNAINGLIVLLVSLLPYALVVGIIAILLKKRKN